MADDFDILFIIESGLVDKCPDGAVLYKNNTRKGPGGGVSGGVAV